MSLIFGKVRRWMTKTVTAEELEYGLGILARIIVTQGDAVWPLFERLERELTDLRSRRQRVERHLRNSSNRSDCFR